MTSQPIPFAYHLSSCYHLLLRQLVTVLRGLFQKSGDRKGLTGNGLGRQSRGKGD
jgi:hypothetical protein